VEGGRRGKNELTGHGKSDRIKQRAPKISVGKSNFIAERKKLSL